MSSSVDDGEFWRVETRESKGFRETKDNNAWVTYAVTESRQTIRIK